MKTVYILVTVPDEDEHKEIIGCYALQADAEYALQNEGRYYEDHTNKFNIETHDIK